MSSRDQLELVTQHWTAIERARTALGVGPWSVTLLGRGLAERVWRPE